MNDPASLANAFANKMTDKRIEVLRKIAETGSISQAARETGISYKAAWQAIDTLTNLTRVSIVEKSVGGTGGGGAKVTPEGLRLLEIASALEQKRQEVLKGFQEENAVTNNTSISSLYIRTSMRNYLPCQVSALEMNGQVVRVFLKVHENMAPLVARITRTSTELLALEPGMAVLAMCKAMAVKISGKGELSKRTATNPICGSVTRVTNGDTEDEITMELQPGLQLVGFASSDENIKVGQTVHALFDESAVVVALLP